ncbi:MAG: hypothetical protein LBH68_00645 [Bifidobacteriaceae bacterium]|jgi:hypothetical protein|nr:hypothetical protein [Bifidobacteriaceae bacterium]
MKTPVEPVRAGTPEAAEWLGLVQRVYPDRRFRGGQGRHEVPLLAGTHPLSAGLDFNPLLVRDREGRGIGRCAVTFRTDSPVAYLGLLEFTDPAAAPALFAAAETLAAERGCRAIRGPFEPDYWVGYRLKLDHFDVPPFFGEPFNRPEYPAAWEAAGYAAAERYRSTVLFSPQVPAEGPFSRSTLERRLDSAGVELRPLGRQFADLLPLVHQLVMDRFAVMSEFHPLEFDQFEALMRPLGQVLDRQASQVAWAGDQLVGFAAAMPDFGRSLDSGTARAAALLAGRLRPRALIGAYLAVDDAYRGLGPALTLPGLERAARLGVPGIGALMHHAAPTASYLPDQVSRTHNYAIFHKTLS